MTYRIEITADSLTELAGRVLALSAQLQTTVPVFVHHASAAPAKDPTPAKTAAKKISAMMAAAEPVAPVAEPVAPVAEPVAEYTAPEVRENPVAPATPAAVVYDPVIDIAPRVLAYVALRGRDAMLELLSQFGVERASHVLPEHHAELVALLDAVINA
jgi:cell pole-organizing protein PopZ